MARPIKGGVDYFPFDVSLDEKFELIEAEFGLTGFAVIVKLLQRIYGQQGYYCEFTNEVALLFGRRCGLGGNAVSEIVTAAIKRGIFDKSLFEKYQVLTSKGIQKRYFEAVSRRKSVDVDKRYLLVKCEDFFKNVSINWINVNINPKNDNDNTQSKVKESKVNKNNICSCDDAFARFWSAYPKKTKKPVAERAFKKINPDIALLDKMLKSIEQFKKTHQWQKDNGQFIPYPSTWLNDRRWDEDISDNTKISSDFAGYDLDDFQQMLDEQDKED